jgi:hypothetical protein
MKYFWMIQRGIDRAGYRLCWRVSWFSQFVWCPIWYRWRCPYPIIDDHSVRACVASDNCGCDHGATKVSRETLEKTP